MRECTQKEDSGTKLTCCKELMVSEDYTNSEEIVPFSTEI